MRSRTARWLAALGACAALASPVRVAAMAQHHQQYPYVLVDVGTLGGPQSFLNLPGMPVTENGIALGTADTTTPDAYYPNFNPFIVGSADPTTQHAFAWRNGRSTDLGALPGNNSSAIFALNGRGIGTGMSENGSIDPLTTWPAESAVVWTDGRVVNLGTLPGGYESQALAINNRGQVAGFASNGIADPYSLLFPPTQTRAFIWQDGVMRDLGTLGGPDSTMSAMNERGQITGQSYINNTPNPGNNGMPISHSFLWQDGRMLDLGTLGGAYGNPNALNSWGDVVGQSNLAGDQASHPFLWSRGSLQDLGTLGGDYGAANWINDFRQVVGWAQTPGNATAHAVLWSNGAMRDLGVPPGDAYSFANDINLWGQVVGNAGLFNKVGHGFLWQRGSSLDLNTLVAPSALHIAEALYINDRGEIAGAGVLPNRDQPAVLDQHVVLLIPTDEADREGVVQNAPLPSTDNSAVLPQSSTFVCPSLAAWLAQLKAAPVRSRLAHATPACLGA